jgi:hypothetical protein
MTIWVNILTRLRESTALFCSEETNRVTSATEPTFRLAEKTVVELRVVLPGLAERTVAAIIEAVPSYSDALAGPMGDTIRAAVETALGGFVQLASRSAGETPPATAVDGAYQLGRGEARSGRTVDALLSAYRIGARVSWQELSSVAVRTGVDADTLGRFAALVFAYIEQLSAASLAGHTDELENTGRVRQRLLERLAVRLLDGSPPEAVADAAERAEWRAPRTLTAVVVPGSQVRPVLTGLSVETLQAGEAPQLADGDGEVALLVPDVHGRGRAGLLRALADRGAVAGPARPWQRVGESLERAARVRRLGLGPDSEEHLVDLVLSADAAALADLRERVLAPLDDLGETAAAKLTETLRSWLLHHGRRDAVAAELFVHPQTVRYRMGQLREVFGDRLEDPDSILELTIALGVRPRRSM